MPLPQLERRVMPFMGGADYLGPELNGDTYRLKFMQNGRVIWVDVDGQSGASSAARAQVIVAARRLTFAHSFPVVPDKQLLAATRVDGAKMNSSGEH